MKRTKEGLGGFYGNVLSTVFFGKKGFFFDWLVHLL